MTTEPIESHAVHSRRMLDHAAAMLAQGDRLQASEKIWGAAAHRLKEIAAERQWPNDSHADGFAIIQYISDGSLGDRRISDLFGHRERHAPELLRRPPTHWPTLEDHARCGHPRPARPAR